MNKHLIDAIDSLDSFSQKLDNVIDAKRAVDSLKQANVISSSEEDDALGRLLKIGSRERIQESVDALIASKKTPISMGEPIDEGKLDDKKAFSDEPDDHFVIMNGLANSRFNIFKENAL